MSHRIRRVVAIPDRLVSAEMNNLSPSRMKSIEWVLHECLFSRYTSERPFILISPSYTYVMLWLAFISILICHTCNVDRLSRQKRSAHLQKKYIKRTFWWDLFFTWQQIYQFLTPWPTLCQNLGSILIQCSSFTLIPGMARLKRGMLWSSGGSWDIQSQ